jgi:hypothetical protein
MPRAGDENQTRGEKRSRQSESFLELNQRKRPRARDAYAYANAMEQYTERRMCRSQPSVKSELARRGVRELKMIKGQPLSAVKTLPTVHLKATQTYKIRV